MTAEKANSNVPIAAPKRSALILPGAASPKSPTYAGVYAAIEEEAQRRGFQCCLLHYPGQEGGESGRLSYASALLVATESLRRIRPAWIVARSFGCLVAVGALSCREKWVSDVEGVVLWGPVSRAGLLRLFPGSREKENEIQRYRKRHNTWMERDFFDSQPTLGYMIQSARTNLRLVRGAVDQYNDEQDIAELHSLHSSAQPGLSCEAREVAGLAHTVNIEETNDDLVWQYFDALFDPIGL